MHTLRASCFAFGLGASLAVASSLSAQQEISLTSADATFPESFSYIGGIRELKDGRLLIADPLGQVLVAVNLSAGRADTIGRVGGGPEEYRQPDGLFPLPGDSTLLVDLGNGRLTVLDPDLKFVETMPIAQGSGEGGPGSFVFALPRGVDSKGRVYFQQSGRSVPGGGGMPDSSSVVRLDRATGTMDTIMQVKEQDREITTSGSANNRNMMMRQIPMSPRDEWAVSWDGRVAAARTDSYRVEWIELDGQVVRGPKIDFRPLRIQQADKEAYVEGLGRDGLMVGMTIENGVRQASFRRGGGGRRAPDVDSYDWPEVMPAFRPGGVSVAPDGSLWVERYVPSGSAPMIDVFDAAGRLVKRVTLPAGRELVGFGAGTLFVVARDEFDLLWLEQYAVGAGA